MHRVQWECPGCGARSFIDPGRGLIKCPYCHGKFVIPRPEEKKDGKIRGFSTCPICGEENTPRNSSQCPWCMRTGICNSHFADGICTSCHDVYLRSAAKSADQMRVRRIAQQELGDFYPSDGIKLSSDKQKMIKELKKEVASDEGESKLTVLLFLGIFVVALAVGILTTIRC